MQKHAKNAKNKKKHAKICKKHSRVTVPEIAVVQCVLLCCHVYFGPVGVVVPEHHQVSSRVSFVVKAMLPRVKRARTSQSGAGVNSHMMGSMDPNMMASMGMGVNPAMMGMNPFLAQMFGPMMGMQSRGQQQVAPAEEESDGGESQHVAPATAEPAEPAADERPGLPLAVAADDIHQNVQDAFISRSVTYLKQLPRQRLSECLEHIYGGLDAVLTAPLSMSGLLCVLWTYTRMVPSVKISDLRILIVMFHYKFFNDIDIRSHLFSVVFCCFGALLFFVCSQSLMMRSLVFEVCHCL